MSALIPLLMMSVGAPPLVLVPTSKNPQACFALESIASTLALSAELRVIREDLRGRSLHEAKKMLRADWAITGRRTGGKKPRATVELLRDGGADQKSTQALPILDVLESVWPKKGPALPRERAFAAAHPSALEAACRGDAAAAYEASGPAPQDAIRRLVAPPPKAAKDRSKPSLLMMWARASAELRDGKCTSAKRLLTRAVGELEKGASAPTWRLSAALPGPATAAQRLGERAIVFSEGQFFAFDAKSGRSAWSLKLNEAEPALSDLGDGLAIALSGTTVVLLRLRDGREIIRQKMSNPHPEIATAGDLVFVAGGDELRAIDKKRAKVVWSYESTSRFVAGPVVHDGLLVAPTQNHLLLLERRSGKLQKEIELPDEVASPLFLGSSGLWMTIGGDKLARAAPGDGSIKVWDRDLLGATWPPADVGSGIALGARHSRRGPFVVYVPKAGAVDIINRGGLPPVLALNNERIVFAERKSKVLVASRLDGKRAWRATFGSPVFNVAAGPRGVFTNSGRASFVLEPERGKIVRKLAHEAPITAANSSADGGVVALEGNLLYGLPGLDDPRRAVWRSQMYGALTDCAIQQKQSSQARRYAQKIIDAQPNDLDGLAWSARATESANRARAARLWHSVMRRAPRGDRLQHEARTHTRESVGLVARIALPAPIDKVVTSTDGAIVALAGGHAYGLSERHGKHTRWSARAKSVAPSGTRALYVDGQLVEGKTGRVVRKRGRAGLLDAPEGLFRAKADMLSKETLFGKKIWSQRFEHAGLQIADADADRVLVTDSVDGIVTVLDARTGRREWMRPFQKPVRAAKLAGDGALIAFEDELVGVDASDGRERFRTRPPKNGAPRVYALGDDWLFVTQARMQTISSKNGRPKRSTSFPRRTEAVAVFVDQNVAIARLEGGRLLAFEIKSGRKRGTLQLENAGSVHELGDRLGVLESTKEALLLFDPAQMLMPARR